MSRTGSFKIAPDLRQEMGSRIKKHREKTGLTTYAFSNLVGIRQSTLCDYERGRISPSVIMLFTIAKELGISTHKLLPEPNEIIHSGTRKEITGNKRGDLPKSSKTNAAKKNKPKTIVKTHRT